MKVKKRLSDKKERVLILGARINDFNFLLINFVYIYIYIYILYIYNANTEKEQVGVLKGLTTTLSNFKNVDNHTVIFAGDFHMFVDASLDAKVGTPNLKS